MSHDYMVYEICSWKVSNHIGLTIVQIESASRQKVVKSKSLELNECTYFETATSGEVGRYARSTRRVTI